MVDVIERGERAEREERRMRLDSRVLNNLVRLAFIYPFGYREIAKTWFMSTKDGLMTFYFESDLDEVSIHDWSFTFHSRTGEIMSDNFDEKMLNRVLNFLESVVNMQITTMAEALQDYTKGDILRVLGSLIKFTSPSL
jgi:hypothetical protein